MKAQVIRLADVAGPAMIAGGFALTSSPQSRPVLGIGLLLMGVGTIVYNAGNYLRAAR